MATLETVAPLVTLGEIGRRTGHPGWWLRRLFDRGDLHAECVRVGSTRAIYARDLERVLARVNALAAQRPSMASAG